MPIVLDRSKMIDLGDEHEVGVVNLRDKRRLIESFLHSSAD